MKKRLLSLLLSLCIMVALLPAASAAEDYTKYFTDQLITDEDINFSGVPLVELTYEKAKEILSSMRFEYPIRFTDTDSDISLQLELDWDLSGLNDPFKGSISFDLTNRNLPTVNFVGGLPTDYENPEFRIMEIATSIRGISTGDTVEEALKKLGISEEGSKIISNRIMTSNEDFIFGKDHADFYEVNREAGIPTIVYKGDLYHLQLNVLEDKIISVLTCIDTFQRDDLAADEYIYGTPDPGEDIVLPVWRLEEIIDADCTVRSIDTLLEEVPLEKLQTPTGTDLAALYAETAIMRAACKEVDGGDLMINAALLKIVGSVAEEAQGRLEEKLESVGIPPAREISKTVTLMTDETTLDIRIDPDVLQTQIDKIRVETPTYALTFKLEDLKDSLTDVLQFRAEDVGGGYRASQVTKKAGVKTVVKVDMPNGKMSNPVTVSMPKQTGETVHQAVVSTDGQATASKYNPASDLIDGKVNTSGSYTVKSNEKDFSDIANKSQEMQKAIRYLASKGIINGTTETAFSPDGSINRAEIATLIVKALGKLDPSAASGFTDVPAGSWYAAAAASSQRQGYIQGFEDHTFRGPTVINKVQIISVSSRVLQKEMRYKAPAAPASILTKYSDTVDTWAQSDVALATKENLVLYRKDGTFSGRSNMTRGNAAIIIYRLFQRLW